MRFTLPALSGLTLLTWHQALALPATPAEIAKVERDITTPYNATALQMLDPRSPALLQPRDATWYSTPLQTQLLFDMSVAAANDIEILDTLIAWKLTLSFRVDSGGQGYFRLNVTADGDQLASEVEVCIIGSPSILDSGMVNGNHWAQVSASLEVSWTDTVTSKLLAVFWGGTYTFYENDGDLTVIDSTGSAPYGWIQPPLPPGTCPQSGVGTAVPPKSWNFLPWSTVSSKIPPG